LGYAALPVGSFDCFCASVETVLDEKGLPHTLAEVEKVLPREDEGFTVRMHRPLRKSEIERID